MKILCLHGRNSNNEIFQVQTAFLRAEFEDSDFEYVQGTVENVEANWHEDVFHFTKQNPYSYYNPLSSTSIQQAETELLDLIQQEGPFDGVLAFCMGAALAAQVIIKDILDNPGASRYDRLFKFAIFINGITPIQVIENPKFDTLSEKELHAMRQELDLEVMGRSNLKNTNGAQAQAIQKALNSVTLTKNFTGHVGIYDGEGFMTRYNQELDGALIDIPTLHIRDPKERGHHGSQLETLCEFPENHFHSYGHDFPRGQREMQKIAEISRSFVETVI